VATRAGRRRRAPRPQDRQRDPERTRQALLDAALAEFAAKGLAGARVSEIAARAGVNKQLISYYFDGKDGLYQALIERWLAQEAEFAAAELPFEELVAGYVDDSVAQYELHRLFVRESLDTAAPGAPRGLGIDEEDVADVRRRQEEGEIADDLDPAALLLMLEAAVSVGVTYPADVRKLTGLDPRSREFADYYGEQLRRVLRHLAPPGGERS
jgi:TetR/AcrR family transcriptional regulator